MEKSPQGIGITTPDDELVNLLLRVARMQYLAITLGSPKCLTP
jgi:hypothetical protein